MVTGADLGFPVGGGGGGADVRCGHFSVKMCAKTKELGPIGLGRSLDPPMDKSYKPQLGYRLWYIQLSFTSNDRTPTKTRKISIQTKANRPLRDKILKHITI